MEIKLDPMAKVARFRHGGLTRTLDFAQLGQFLIGGAPQVRGEREEAQHWWKAEGLQFGVSPNGNLIVQQEVSAGMAELPVEDMTLHGKLYTKEDVAAWAKYAKEGIIGKSTKQKEGEPYCLVRCRVPQRVWHVKLAPNGGIIEARVFVGRLDKLKQWTGGNADESGGICWGHRPPVFPVPCPIEQLDLIFLTGSPFNEHIQRAGEGHFTWNYPSRWRTTTDKAGNRMVLIGLGRTKSEPEHVDNWTGEDY